MVAFLGPVLKYLPIPNIKENVLFCILSLVQYFSKIVFVYDMI